MNDIKVSVIIPVYNVEEYLKECLDSVINQTLKEIEIICIDDCSTDNSYKILEEYAKKDSRIKLFKHKENNGLGPARNTGIKHSNGEYLSFIDSDDYISLDFFEKLYNTAKKYNSDVVSTLNLYTDAEKDISYLWCNINKYIKKDEEMITEYKAKFQMQNFNRVGKNMIFFSVWNKIYRRTLIINNDIFFMDIKFGSEDVDFDLRLFYHNPNLSYNNEAKYYYRKRHESLMGIMKVNINSGINCIEHMYNTIKFYQEKSPELLPKLYNIVWHPPFYTFSISEENNKIAFYKYLYKFANNIKLNKNEDTINIKEYNEYLLIKSNNTYEKYLLTKEMFDKINNINNKINELEKKINQFNSNITKVNEANTNNISKKNTNIKLFGIDKLSDRKIIYIFGIKITLKR